MRKQRVFWRAIAAAVIVIGVISLGACTGGFETVIEETAEMVVEDEPVDGEALLKASCTQCHNLERTTSKQKTAEEWEKTVDNMIAKGAQVSDKQALIDYLAETYGP